METATAVQMKRLRFNTMVHSPNNDVPTPLMDAKKMLQVHAESLQTQISTITSKLGKQHLLLLHQIHSKQLQAKKLENDALFIPRSARVGFTLSTSKLVSQTWSTFI